MIKLGSRLGDAGETVYLELIKSAEQKEKERVSAALARLSDEDREVIVLRDLEGFTGPEAAALLDVDLGALKSRLHRARLRLMAELREVTDVD